MKHLALIGVVGVLAVTGAASARPGGPNPNDGILTIEAGIGRVVIEGRGVLIGHFDRGQVTIRDPNPNDGPAPLVTGADTTRDINDKTTRYSGTDLSFRIIGGKYSVTMVAMNIHLTVKGRAIVTLAGRGTADDGTFSVNDGVPQPIPDFPIRFLLLGPAPQPAPGG